MDFSKEDHPGRLLKGLYPSEGQWRWTRKSFSVLLDPPKTSHPVFLELDLAFPGVASDRFGPLTITAKANGHAVGRETYEIHGRYMFAKRVPTEALRSDKVVLEFEADKSFQPEDGVERSLIVSLSSVERVRVSRNEYLTEQARQAREGLPEDY